MPDRSPLGEVAGLFLKLGTVAFGGPAAHIAMMEAEVVRRRGWLTHAEFLDLLGATNLLPGPNSTEMAIHLGYRRAGWPGLLVGGACFILPAALMTSALGWVYVRFSGLPRVEGLLDGVKPVVVAVVAQAIWNLGRKALDRPLLVAMAVGAAVASLLGADEIAVLVAAGVVVAALRARAGAAALGVVPVAGAAAPAVPFGLAPLFFVFLKIGAVLFGSGYVLLAFLRTDLVERLGWLTEPQLLDAVAVGQVTPGPVFTTATFIGFVLGGPAGAAVATLGIFLPAFVLVAASGPLIPRLRASPVAGAVLDGVNAASLGLMAAVALQLGRSAIVDPLTAALAVGAAVALVRFRVNATWPILVGAVVGLLRG